MKKRKQPVEQFRWRITKIKETPAKLLGHVHAGTESEALKKAMVKFQSHTTTTIVAQLDD
jgi:hypothetical protein